MGYHGTNEEFLIVNVAARFYRLVPVALHGDTVTYGYNNLSSGSVEILQELKGVLTLTMSQHKITIAITMIGRVILDTLKMRQ